MRPIPASPGASAAKQPAKSEMDDSWIGVYSSPAEIAGFSGTVLAIERDSSPGRLTHRMKFHGDVALENTIKQPEMWGDIVTEGEKVYVAIATGFMIDGRPSLHGGIARYTRVQIRGRTVLMRDDALRVYQREQRFYDYGILIKVSDTIDRFKELTAFKHESIKTLFNDPTKEWKDPFVHGPNG